ncbi:MAG: hypothetical protein EPN97_04105 [Alphaproteobacteria bacterium]|nr:MAG: hypothetical protein EPN97_04105 [Alphaproteobacteria bacterium]
MYIFYDTETSGLERSFAQVLQGAFVVTDDDLNIIASKKIECRLSPWIVPGPGALLTTKFTKDDLTNRKHSAFQMMQEIDTWLRTQSWPLIFAGFNTLGYDEDVLGQNFYVNMLEPGLTQAAHPSGDGRRNTRFDVLNAVQAVQAYMPGVLKLDTLSEKGNPVLKLSVVAEQNGVGLSKDAAHDALNDIIATVGVAKVIKNAAPEIWAQMHRLATQEGVDAFMAENKVFTHTAVFFGKNKPMVATSVAMRGHRTEILFDLSIDPAPYLSMSVEQLKEAIANQSKKPAKNAPPPVAPFRFVRKDQQPVMMPIDMSDAVLPPQFDEKLAAARAEAIKANPQFLEDMKLAAQMVKDEKDAAATQKREAKAQAAAAPKTPENTTENPAPKRRSKKAAPSPAAAAPVQGKEEIPEERKQEILKKADEWKQEFRNAATWKKKAALAEGFAARFAPEISEYPPLERFTSFAFRIIFEHAPEALTPQKQLDIKREVAATVLSPDPDAPWMTVAKACAEIEAIEKDRAAGKKNKWDDIPAERLAELKQFYATIEKKYAPYLQTAGNDNAPTAATPAPAKAKPGPSPK